MNYEAVIGLEVHAQLSTQSKIFCGCSTHFGAAPNSQGCPVCLGLPGSLPVLNRKVVEFAIRAGLATHCTIAGESIFARKNYFYPDLPKGYQISQYDRPLAQHGFLEIDGVRQVRRIGICRIHLEEDAGKLIHDQDAAGSLFDVNRCGTPLIEIVTDPDLRSPREAFLYLTSLKQILEYLDVCDCNMEEGSLRCDANISIRPVGETRLGTKTELKNMNSFHGVEKALEYEIKRQTELVLEGGKITQETLLWDARRNEALPMRSKEDAHDYRYFPEPDLIPVRISDEWVDQVRARLPEMPEQRRKRFIEQYALRDYDAGVLTSDRSVADYFEATAGQVKDGKLVSNWIQTEVLRLCNERHLSVARLALTPSKLASILLLLKSDAINKNAAKEILDQIAEKGGDPQQIVKEKGLGQVSSTEAIEKLVDDVIRQNPAEVEGLKQGKEKLFGFLVGQAMKAAKGKANPALVNEILKKRLEQF